MPRRASGMETIQKACQRLHPSVRATRSLRGVIWSKVTRIVRTAKAQATLNCASTTLGTAKVTGTIRSTACPKDVRLKRINSASPSTSGGSTMGMSNTASTRFLTRLQSVPRISSHLGRPKQVARSR